MVKFREKIEFNKNVKKALKNENLQKALLNIKKGFIEKRTAALIEIDEFEENLVKNGGKLHYANTAEQANQTIVSICKDKNAKSIIKGKSMLSEEIDLNSALIENGFEVIESDLGEYIIQLRGETPSHIIAPAVHLNREQIADDFMKHHKGFDKNRDMSEPETLVKEARAVLRDKFLNADVGITGANFLVAENGAAVIVTNEGNGDLSQILPKTHIVVASIEKVVPKLKDIASFIRLLGRAATGQDITAYTSFMAASKAGEGAGEDKDFHVIMLDNGRSDILKSDLSDILRCIRCGACINHCPVYQSVGGHAYGWVYPGPMGAVLTPCFIGIDNASDLYFASSFCGRCEEVCTMDIPLPDLMRNLRVKNYRNKSRYSLEKIAINLWAFLVKRPRLYQLVMAMNARLLASFLFSDGENFRAFMVKLVPNWFENRNLLAPSKNSFMAQYKRQSRMKCKIDAKCLQENN